MSLFATLLNKVLEFGISYTIKFTWTGYKHKDIKIEKKDDKYIWKNEK